MEGDKLSFSSVSMVMVWLWLDAFITGTLPPISFQALINLNKESLEKINGPIAVLSAFVKIDEGTPMSNCFWLDRRAL